MAKGTDDRAPFFLDSNINYSTLSHFIQFCGVDVDAFLIFMTGYKNKGILLTLPTFTVLQYLHGVYLSLLL